MPPEVVEVRRWLAKAKRDWRLAVAGLEQVPPIADGAAFHCQQAVEKLLKAYLVYVGGTFEKIHDLETLVSRCAERDSDFVPLNLRVAPLTPFAVRFRYPGPSDPTPEQVRQALEVVREVWDFILEKLPHETHP